MLFNDLAIEFPSDVQESAFILRDRVRSLKAQMNMASDSTLARTLDALGLAVLQFLDDAGRDLQSITVTSGDPRFDKFCSDLSEFRIAAAIAILPLAEEQNVKADWVTRALEH